VRSFGSGKAASTRDQARAATGKALAELSVVFEDEHRRRRVAASRARMPEDGVGHGAAALAVRHGQAGRHSARVVLGVQRRVPIAGHNASIGFVAGARLEAAPSDPSLLQLRLDIGTAVGARAQVDVDGKEIYLHALLRIQLRDDHLVEIDFANGP